MNVPSEVEVQAQRAASERAADTSLGRAAHPGGRGRSSRLYPRSACAGAKGAADLDCWKVAGAPDRRWSEARVASHPKGSFVYEDRGARPTGGSGPETPGTVIGNTTPKYTSDNPAIRWLTERWVANLERIFDRIATADGHVTEVLEVGCGEGIISGKLHERWPHPVGLDLPDAGLRVEWWRRGGPHFVHGDAHRLPFADNTFDVIVSVEVLEHLLDPQRGLAEMARVGRGHLVLSVPREPIFRTSNLLAGRYVRSLGNTPGHLNHWSTGGFVRFVSSIANVREVSRPFPWTTVWATLP